MLRSSSISISILAAVLAALAPSPVAAIQCDGDFQIVNGYQVSTPYCRDQHLAAVARKYGIKTSDDAIRNNPKHKEEVCRIVGRDIRVDQACIDVLPGSRGRR